MIILIVEDDTDIQNTYRQFFQLRFEAEVIPALDVSSALEALSEQSFDLVITDFQLPDGTGAEVVRAVRGLAQQPPVVLHSGAHDLADHGADAFLPKPSDFSEMAALCARLVA